MQKLVAEVTEVLREKFKAYGVEVQSMIAQPVPLHDSMMKRAETFGTQDMVKKHRERLDKGMRTNFTTAEIPINTTTIKALFAGANACNNTVETEEEFEFLAGAIALLYKDEYEKELAAIEKQVV